MTKQLILHDDDYEQVINGLECVISDRCGSSEERQQVQDVIDRINLDCFKKSARKDFAIKRFKQIQKGSGVDRSSFPDIFKGTIAKELWHEGHFSYGMEYGYLLALISLFNLTPEDLGWSPEEIENPPQFR